MHIYVQSMSLNMSAPKAASPADHPSEILEGTSLASDWVVVDDSASPKFTFEDGRDAVVAEDPRVSEGASAEISETDKDRTQSECNDAEDKAASRDKAEENKEEGEAGSNLSQKNSEDEGELELDVCFICDCTGSMGSYIEAAQGSMQHIAKTLSERHRASLRLCVVSYRDHPPQDKTYVTCCSGFNTDLKMMQTAVQELKAAGGGDGPEALTAGLREALKAPWRPNATKVCILIADAPPHGLEPEGDGLQRI